jgi:uncharacterized DUF497 family protein
MEFRWNPEKAASNLHKHRISFWEAISVFDDPLAVTYDAPDHSEQEERFITYGLSDQNRLLIVSHTLRAGQTRIISARKATRQERNFYEDTE